MGFKQNTKSGEPGKMPIEREFRRIEAVDDRFIAYTYSSIKQDKV